MSSSKIILILGAGPRIGAKTAEKFTGLGYKVAVVSRKGEAVGDALAIKADLGDSAALSGVFETVQSKLGASPDVVVYNAASLTPAPEEGNIFSIPAARIVHDFNVTTIGAYAAAQQAMTHWKGSGKKGTFIYTGNILNKVAVPVPMFLNLGIGKSASAFWVAMADTLYKKDGYRFFYADERTADGKLKGMALDGEAHAEFFEHLATQPQDVPWEATFVKGKGYVNFE